MMVQLDYMNDGLVTSLKEILFVPAIVVTIFSGWRVVAVSFEVSGRIYVCADKGVVVCNFEIRMTALSSVDAICMDADRLEFSMCRRRGSLCRWCQDPCSSKMPDGAVREMLRCRGQTKPCRCPSLQAFTPIGCDRSILPFNAIIQSRRRR